MALLFLDGFEEYDTTSSTTFTNELLAVQAQQGVAYNYTSLNTLNGSITQTRTAQTGISAKSMIITASVLGVSVPNVTTLHIGFGGFFNSLNNWICGFCRDPAHSYLGNPTNGMRVYLDTAGTISIRNNNTAAVIATSSSTLSINTWYYIEIKYVFGSGTAGSCQIKVDGVDYINSTSIDTAGTAALINSFYFQSTNPATNYYDDFYICDTTGATNNTFLGPISVYTLVPTANSATVEMTASAGLNFACVDDIPPNITDYVTGTAANQIDLYAMSDLPVGVTPTTIPGVLLKAKSSKPTANTGQIQMAARYSAVSSFSTSRSVTQTSYIGNCSIMETQPDGSAWVKAAIDGIEAGIKVV